MLLHAVLIGGALLFALPYAWLVGTSWKLDKEIQSEEIRIWPDRPIPVAVSPYIERRQFAPIERPEIVQPHRWDWMKDIIGLRIASAVGGWSDPRLAGLDEPAVRAELAEGVFARVVGTLAPSVWAQDDRTAFSAALDQATSPEVVAACFDQAYRCFAVGGVRLVTADYRVINLEDPAVQVSPWAAEAGSVRLEAREQAGRPVWVGHYDLRENRTLTISSAYRLGIGLADAKVGFKRIELSFRGDESWHDLRVELAMAGRRYVSEEPRYLALDSWSETQFQLPGPDDQRLMPRRYVRLIEAGPDSSPDAGLLRISVRVERSSALEALWAKGTENYRKAFDEVPFWRYFKTSSFLVLVNIIGTLLSCSLAAYAFARLHWPGRDLCFLLVLATLMIPPQVTMIPSFVIYRHLGWYNTLAPLWVPNALAVNGFAVFLLRQAMRGIPRDLEEAARIDGAGHLRIWWHIVLPLVRPTMAAIAIFTFMFVWNDFLGPLIYVNDQRLYPLALGLFSFMAGRENQFTLIMAGAMIMTLPVILIFFFAQRYFIQGVAMSGMKN